jgi:hypothetical protein
VAGGLSASQEAIEAADLLEDLPLRRLRPLLASLSSETRLELLEALRAAQVSARSPWSARPDRSLRLPHVGTVSWRG